MVQDYYADQYRHLYRYHWWWRARERYVLERIDDIHRTHQLDKIFDIGCGDALFFPMLSRYGEVKGLEPDERLLSPDSPWRQHIEVTSFGPDYHSSCQYDLVVMLDVLEHTENDRETLAATFNLVKPGKFLILTVPALPILWSHHDEANCHFRRYTYRTLSEVVQRTRFDLLRIDYYFGWTVFPLLLRRWLHPPDRNNSKRNAEYYKVSIPKNFVHRRLLGLCLLEQKLFHRWSLPIGSSLCAVLQRPVT